MILTLSVPSGLLPTNYGNHSNAEESRARRTRYCGPCTRPSSSSSGSAACANSSSAILQVMSPFTLRYLIQFATDAYAASNQGLPPPHLAAGLSLVFGVTIMQVLQSLCTSHFIYRGMLVGGMTRASLISLIYEKSMVISGRAKAGGAEISDPLRAVSQETEKGKQKKIWSKEDAPGPAGISGDGSGWGTGRIMNLMSVDTYRIDYALGLFHMSWTAPISCLVTLVMLVINLTYKRPGRLCSARQSACLSLPEPSRALFVRRKSINRITDNRVSLTQEILRVGALRKVFRMGNCVPGPSRKIPRSGDRENSSAPCHTQWHHGN